MRGMRIALVTTAFGTSYGGLQTCVGRLVAGLSAHGAKTDVFALAEHTAGRAEPPPCEGVHVRRFAPAGRRQFRFSPSLIAELARGQSAYDVIHLFDVHTPMPAAAALCGRPTVLTPAYHGRAVSPIVAPFHRALTSAICRRSERIVCASRSEQHLLERQIPHARGRIAVIVPGATSHSLAPAREIAGERARLLVVGRLVKYKRVRLALEALAVLPDDVTLTIAGSGPEEGRLRRQAQELGLQPRVRFVGSPEDEELGKLYRAHDVLLSLSTRESLGLAVLDAAASGLGLAVSDIPPHREVLSRWARTGATVPVAAGPDEIACAVMAALQTRAAPDTVLPGWDAYVKDHLALYQELTQGAG